MAYEGYLRFGGNEIINATRTATYVRNLTRGLSFRDIHGTKAIEEIEGEKYDSPALDDAPWVDASDPATTQFLGLYPLDIEGIQGSTTVAEVVESLGNGGYVNNPRDASREIRVRGVMLATSELGLDAGLTWLNAALRPQACIDHGGSCTGATLCYYAAKPEIKSCYRDPQAGDTPAIYVDETTGVMPIFPGGSVGPRDTAVRVVLQPSDDDGLVIRVGSSRWAGDINNIYENLDQIYGPIVMRRTNNVINPRFAVDTYGWNVIDGDIVQVPSGGPDDGSYAQIAPAPGETVGLETSISDSPSGANILSFQLRGHAAGGGFWVSVVLPDSTVVTSELFTMESGWNSYTLTVPYATGATLRFESTHGFDLTHIISERSTTSLGYFDGDTVPEDDYSITWLGTPHRSRSRLAWIGTIRFDACGPWSYPWVFAESGAGTVRTPIAILEPITPEEQVLPYERYMRHVTRIDGPRVVERLRLSDGFAAVIDFVLVAGVPYAYTTPTDLLVRMPISALDVIEDWVDETPPTPPVSIIVDPDCPPIPAPPRPPVISNDCVANPEVWDRYYYSIPAEEVGAWVATIPTLALTSTDEEVRQVRVRMTPNPFGWDAMAVDPFAYCSEFILSYLPANTELVVDTTVERAWATVAGAQSAPASNLLYGTDGGPMSWPEMSCGVPYLLTIDVPAGTTPDILVSLALSRRE